MILYGEQKLSVRQSRPSADGRVEACSIHSHSSTHSVPFRICGTEWL